MFNTSFNTFKLPPKCLTTLLVSDSSPRPPGVWFHPHSPMGDGQNDRFRRCCGFGSQEHTCWKSGRALIVLSVQVSRKRFETPPAKKRKSLESLGRHFGFRMRVPQPESTRQRLR